MVDRDCGAYGYRPISVGARLKSIDRVPSEDQTMAKRQEFLLPNAPTCIAACAATDARLWRSDTRYGTWTLQARMVRPEAAEREAEFASDRPGRAFDSFGSGRHAMGTGESGRDHELRRFAKEVADYLNRAIAAGEFRHIVLIAAPGFLGHLRARLSDVARRAVVYEAAKDLTDLDVDDIRNYFM